MDIRDDLGDRMKSYEAQYNLQFPTKHPLMLRLDGVHFHSNVRQWKCLKPFDNDMVTAMQTAALTLCEKIGGAHFAYVQSDEITILVRDDMNDATQPWYNNELNKIMSVASSIATNAFNQSLGGTKFECKFFEPMAEFDCRGYVLPEHEIANAFIWRQLDAMRNSVQMLGRSFFGHNVIQNRSNAEIKDMLWHDHNVNWNNLRTELQRGACIIKTYIDVPNMKMVDGVLVETGTTVRRSHWEVDHSIPVFTEHRDYITSRTSKKQ